MNCAYPSTCSLPAQVGEYAYYSSRVDTNSGMLHYWNVKTTARNSTVCHFSHYSPNLSRPGLVCKGRILSVNNELTTY